MPEPKIFVHDVYFFLAKGTFPSGSSKNLTIFHHTKKYKTKHLQFSISSCCKILKFFFTGSKNVFFAHRYHPNHLFLVVAAFTAGGQ